MHSVGCEMQCEDALKEFPRGTGHDNANAIDLCHSN